MSSLRDHELFFYEEASYRPGVIEADCTPTLYPGSSWIDVGASAGCFIHNVPMTASDGIPVPRGSVDLDVMFTDDDWNVPRRITTIALNDDVDEPTEVWEEVARVLATFGRSIERGLRRVAEVDGVGERLAYLFAHLELEGEGSFLRKLASDENDALGRRALSAPAHAERARAHRDRVAGPDDVGEEDPIREFSRRFLARVGE